MKLIPLFLLLLGVTFTVIIFSSFEKNKYKVSSNHSNDEDVRYYSSIVFRETPYARQKGMIKLNKEQIKKRGHYRFIFDEHEQIIEISFRQGNSYKRPNHTTDYYHFPATIIRTKYEKNKEIKSFFNGSNRQISVRGSVYNEVYELDDLGNRKSLYFLDDQGQRIENNWNVAKYTWEIKDDGCVIEERFNLNNTPQPLRPYFPFYRIRLCYDSNGYISLMQNIDEEGNLIENETGVAQDKIEFDSKGRWLGWKVLDKNGKLTEGNGPNVAKGINVPDAFGYETSIRYEDRFGNAIINSHGFWGSKRFYDEFGNFSSTYFIDSIGNPTPNIRTGYTYAIYEWDETGMNRVTTRLLDVNRKPIAHKIRGYSIIKDEYDDKNRLIKASFFNEKGILTNRLDNGVAYIIYTYENGIRTSRNEFDASHNRIVENNNN